jgi:hypothetical protein
MRADKAEAHASAAQDGEGKRNLPGTGEGAEVRAVAAGQTKPQASWLMEAVVERSNMLCAYERVVKNEGAPGVDGLTVAELKPWLQAHWGNPARRTDHAPYTKGNFDRLGILILRFGADAKESECCDEW